jgi:lipopolysaccharide transport system ATP-binding protein
LTPPDIEASGAVIAGRGDAPVAVACRDLRKRFPVVGPGEAWRLLLGSGAVKDAVEAIRGVSLSVHRGAILGVLGRNGAGKSTLLRLLAGVYAPSAGSVTLGGEVASLFELGGLGTRFITGRQYALRLLRFQGVPRRQLAALVDEIRDFSELGEFFERHIFTYSSGMAARLYFAVATAIRRDIYLIDELLSVGDEHFQAKCWQRIRERLGDGASGVLVTHDWSAVIKLCERSLILERGTVADAGGSDRMVARYLGTEPPERRVARFLDLPSTFEARSGEDWSIEVPFEVDQDAAIEMAFSIELLRLGVGWEVMILATFTPVAAGPGRFAARLAIPALPLAPDTYSLNFYLCHRDADGTLQTSDGRKWLTGNDCRLVVTGAPTRAACKIPVTWRQEPPRGAP